MKRSFLPLILLAISVAGLRAENWPNWRGPNQNGTSSETGLPTTFSKTENVKWVSSMPGEGASTPVIWGDHVFVTSAMDADQVAAFALDRTTGEELWRKVFEGNRQDNRSNYASPSPVTDGERVIFFFGNGVLAAYDFKGDELWMRDITGQYGEFSFGWTFSSSPLLYDGKLILQVLQRNEPANGRGVDGAESFLLAFDPATGEELFKAPRPSDAVAESLEAFTTPIGNVANGRNEIVVVGGDCITGHDPESGSELWRWGTWNPEKIGHWRIVPSPVYGEGVYLVCAPKDSPVYAVKAGLEGTQPDVAALAWKSEPTKEVPVESDVSTPAYHDGRFYILSSGSRAMNVVEPGTGRVIYSERLDSRDKIEASPTIADGKIYLINHLGDVFVLKAGDEFEVLHTAEMGESMKNITRSSIAVSQGNLFIRTDTHLYCIGS